MTKFWGSPNVLSANEELFVRGVFADVDRVAKGYYDADWGWWIEITEGTNLTSAKNLANQIKKIGTDIFKKNRDEILKALGFLWPLPKFIKLIPWLQFVNKALDALRWKNRQYRITKVTIYVLYTWATAVCKGNKAQGSLLVDHLRKKQASLRNRTFLKKIPGPRHATMRPNPRR